MLFTASRMQLKKKRIWSYHMRMKNTSHIFIKSLGLREENIKEIEMISTSLIGEEKLERNLMIIRPSLG